MSKLQRLLKKKNKLQEKLGWLGDEIDQVEGSYSEHLVADEYDRVKDKLIKVNKKIGSIKFAENELEQQAARYRWLRDNKHLDIWWSVEGPEDRCDNIDADIDSAMLEDADPTFDEQVEQWRHDSEELEVLHMNLDDAGVPRDEDNKELSAWGRVLRLTK